MKDPQPTQRRTTTVLAGLLTTVLFAQNTRADALESALNMIPADAPVAMVVPSLSGLSLKAATLNEQSMGSAVIHMANLLGTIKQMAGVQEGVNNDGPLVVVATDAAALGKNGRADQPPMVVAIPVSDYGAFVGQLGGNGDEAVTPLTLGGG